MNKQDKIDITLDVINNPHGLATAKRKIEGLSEDDDIDHTIEKGETGKITAYLPDRDIFAVFFDDERWGSFKMSEETFNEYFKVELYED